jgi:hypothetical protein
MSGMGPSQKEKSKWSIITAKVTPQIIDMD